MSFKKKRFGNFAADDSEVSGEGRGVPGIQVGGKGGTLKEGAALKGYS